MLQKVLGYIEIIFTRGNGVFLTALVVALAFAAICFVISFLPMFRASQKKVTGSGFVLGFIAFFAGYLIANTRETVMGDVAPVLLTGLGALFALSFVKGSLAPAFSGFMAVVFTSFFFFGGVLGGDHREKQLAENPPGDSNADLVRMFGQSGWRYLRQPPQVRDIPSPNSGEYIEKPPEANY